MIIQDTHTLFSQRFGSTPALVVRAPGRINLLGEHIDYNHGFCLPASIDQAIYIALSPSSGNLEVYSTAHEEGFLPPYREPAWGRYLSSILQLATEQQLPFEAVQGLIHADLPTGAGLSSSAALCCGFIFGLNHLFDWQLSQNQIARMAQQAEHRIGMQCGLMDQFGVLHGKKDHLILMDCVSETYQALRLTLSGCQLILINSNVPHNLGETEYNLRRATCEQAIQRMNKAYPEIKQFRDLSLDTLPHFAPLLTPEMLRLSTYVVAEINRVRLIADMLKQTNVPDPTVIGGLLTQTHEGLRDEYRVTRQETDLLVRLGTTASGILGCRQVGGGFGGCVMMLATKEGMEKIPSILTTYEQKTRLKPDLIEVSLADGIGLV